MNNTTKLAGVGLAACAACCAIPLLSLVGVGAALGATAYWAPLALMALLPLGSIFLLSRRRAVACDSSLASSADVECGCGSCSTQMAALAHRNLAQVSREPLSIALT